MTPSPQFRTARWIAGLFLGLAALVFALSLIH